MYPVKKQSANKYSYNINNPPINLSLKVRLPRINILNEIFYNTFFLCFGNLVKKILITSEIVKMIVIFIKYKFLIQSLIISKLLQLTLHPLGKNNPNCKSSFLQINL